MRESQPSPTGSLVAQSALSRFGPKPPESLFWEHSRTATNRSATCPVAVPYSSTCLAVFRLMRSGDMRSCSVSSPQLNPQQFSLIDIYRIQAYDREHARMCV